LAEEEIHRIIQTEQGELMGNNPINQQKQVGIILLLFQINSRKLS